MKRPSRSEGMNTKTPSNQYWTRFGRNGVDPSSLLTTKNSVHEPLFDSDPSSSTSFRANIRR
ncbi:hypothetical protein TorRG33x02_159380 [Trema orientale]|uniref:Uncharacterized protein n=1 Tax=Trema orientale TaxID=63057 RepID=A0A2P5ES36_TREOI|nr:hypothetical protein TorRG33x02_159380 [Trema orientale]